MRRNWLAGCLGALGLMLIGYAGLSDPDPSSIERDLPLLSSLPESTLGETAGEVPLFESSLVEAAPVAYQEEPRGDAPRAGSFATVAPDHWVVQALRDVYPGEGGGAPELPQNVTRYELAVALARTFEYYGSSQAPQIDLGRLALLEKAGQELREELSLLGVDRNQMKVQIEALTGRLGNVEGTLAQQGTRIAALEKQLQRLRSEVQSHGREQVQLASRVEVGEGERAKLQKKTKAMSEVTGRLVVKTSVAQARLGEMQKKLAEAGEGAGERRAPSSRAVAALARRVASLERGSAGGQKPLQGALSDRLKRLERLVVRVYNRKAEAQGKASGADPSQLDAVRRSIGQLARRIESVEGQRGGLESMDDKAMGEVKTLLKDFFNDFSHRLKSVEKQVF